MASGSWRWDWDPIITRPAAIVRSYGTRVTLRQLYYRLVAAGVLDNLLNDDKRLSKLTAERRRRRTLPELIDRGRKIDRPLTFIGPEEAKEWLARRYRRDRTEGQPRVV